jgi:hypothetical protein
MPRSRDGFFWKCSCGQRMLLRASRGLKSQPRMPAIGGGHGERGSSMLRIAKYDLRGASRALCYAAAITSFSGRFELYMFCSATRKSLMSDRHLPPIQDGGRVAERFFRLVTWHVHKCSLDVGPIRGMRNCDARRFRAVAIIDRRRVERPQLAGRKSMQQAYREPDEQ